MALREGGRKRRIWPVLLLALSLLAGAGWAACGEEPPVAPVAAPTTSPEPAPAEPVAETESGGAPDLADDTSDAGEVFFDSDAGTATEQVMRRWREALEPLFKSRKNATAAVAAKVISVNAEPETKDAGVDDGGCHNDLISVPLRDKGALDFLIAIDTSGSMFPELPDVVNWLSTLELSLREKHVDFQLLVVADQGRLKKQRVPLTIDGGAVQATIGSQDAFETLIRAAGTGPLPRWPQMLRPGSVKHLVVVTDDDATDKRGLPYIEQLVTAAGGALGTVEKPDLVVDLLGGFEPPQPLLQPAAPLATRRCRGGVAPGVAYQRVARQTGGVRAALCSPASLQALAESLSSWPTPQQMNGCIWLLPMSPSERVLEVRAPSAAGGVFRLYEARTAEACVDRKDGWRMTGQFFALCQSTCSSLREGGYTSVEVRTQCEGGH